MNRLKISIVIPNWNGENLLKVCLDSLIKKTSYRNYDIIIVDNKSTDNSIQLIKKHFPKVKIIKLNKNYGFAYAVNKGIKEALEKSKSDYVLLLNNDTIIVQKDWLNILINEFKVNDVGVVGCKLLYENYKIQHNGMIWKGIFLKHKDNGLTDSKMFDNTEECVAVSGAAMIIKKELIEKIGVLDEIYSPFNNEDLDYCLKAKENGFKVLICGKSKIIHKEGTSIKKFESLESFYIRKRCELIFLLRWFKKIPKLNLVIGLPLGIIKIIGTCFLRKENKKIIINKSFFSYIVALIRAFKASIKSYKIHLDRIE